MFVTKNQLMKKTLLLITIIFSISGYGQDSPEAIVEKFFNDYKSNTDKAIDNLYSTNPWSKNLADAIGNMKREVNGYTESYMGKYYGSELITKQNCTESFVLFTYMAKYGRQPLKFAFEFYKPDKVWMLYSFNINSTIEDDVEQAAKLYYLDQYKK